MACAARVIKNATIVRDDLEMQFYYQPKCPRCGKATEGVATGVAYPGSPFRERSGCRDCGITFDLEIVRDY